VLSPPSLADDPGAARPPQVTAPPKGSSLAPIAFGAGIVVTLGLGAVTAWSGIDTLDKHDAFENGDDSSEQAGRDAQLRTNILLGAAIAAAAGTAAIGIFAIDWSPSRKRGASQKLSAGLGPGSMAITFRR
jgi:hypothetical protein